MVKASNLSGKIGYFLAGAVVGAVLGMGIQYNNLLSVLGNRRDITASLATEVTERAKSPRDTPLLQYAVNPWELNCFDLEEGIKTLQALIPQIPTGCEFYTNPFWQYGCDAPEQYEQVKTHREIKNRLDLFQSWYAERKCEQEKNRQL